MTRASLSCGLRLPGVPDPRGGEGPRSPVKLSVSGSKGVPTCTGGCRFQDGLGGKESSRSAVPDLPMEGRLDEKRSF